MFVNLKTLKLSLAVLFCLNLFSVPAHAEDMVHVFRPGDSLWKICEQYARDPHQCWQQLASHNDITRPRSIKPGAALKIPVEWLNLQPKHAVIELLSGEVSIYRKQGGDAEDAEAGSEIRMGDALETGPDSSAKVIFADTSWLELKPESLVIFDRYSRFEESGMVDTSLRLERGRLRTWVKPRPNRRENFIISTPSAVAAVRGTTFDLSVDAEQSLRNEVTEGVVAIEAQGQEQVVNAGYATLARMGEAPMEPVKLLPAPILQVSEENQQISLSWDAVDGAKSYRLEVIQLPQGQLYSEYTTVNASFSKSLPVGEYELRVRAMDEYGLAGLEAQAEAASNEATAAETSRSWVDAAVFVGGAVLLLAL